MNRASRRTKDKLKGVDVRLTMLVGYVLAISPIDFFVNEGVRSERKQREYYKKGASKCDGVKNRSKHQDGKAIDVYYVGWESSDSPTDERWYLLIESFKQAGKMLGLRLEFGYDWGWDKGYPEGCEVTICFCTTTKE